MTAIKTFTSLEQSKKLTEILPLESADMEYMFIKRDVSKVSNVPFVKNDDEPEWPDDGSYDFIPCWSLAALLNVLPKGTNISTPKPINELGYCCWNQYDEVYAVSPVDACVAMIEKLNELNLL